MANPIGSIGSIPSLKIPTALTDTDNSVTGTGESGFQQLLLRSIDQVGDMQHTAHANLESNLLGGDLTQVETFSTMRQADLSLRMMLQVRNKVLDAYNEIKQMRM